MRVGVVVTDPGDWTARSFANNLGERGVDIEFLRLRQATTDFEGIVCGGVDLFSFDALLVRDVGSGGLEEVAFRFDVLVEVEEAGVLVVNPPSAIQLAANKHLSYWYLHRAGLPHPGTLVTGDLASAQVFLSRYGKVVAKPLFGYKGIDVEVVTEGSRLQELLSQRGVLYLQEYIPHGGRDIRVFVVGDEVVGAIYRVAPGGEWVSNLSQGGTPHPCSLSEEQERMAVRASAALGAVYAGIDLVEDGRRSYVLEVNATPSGHGLYSSSGVDVGRHVAEAVLERIEDSAI